MGMWETVQSRARDGPSCMRCDNAVHASSSAHATTSTACLRKQPNYVHNGVERGQCVKDSISDFTMHLTEARGSPGGGVVGQPPHRVGCTRPRLRSVRAGAGAG
jgi:hypothetical protein